MRVHTAKVETPAGARHLMGVHATSVADAEKNKNLMAHISYTGLESTVRVGKWAVARVPEGTDPSALGLYAGMQGEAVVPAGEEVELDPEHVRAYLGKAGASKLLGIDLEVSTQSHADSNGRAA